MGCGLTQIAHGFLLGGNRTLEGHIEVLFPARHGGVSPAEGNIGQSVAQPVRKDGNKTYFDWKEEMPALFVGASDRAEAMDWLQSYQKDLKIVR